MVAVGCGVLAAFALGIGGLTMLWADRPDAETTGPVERTALDLPLIPAEETHDVSTGERPETGRGADDAEAGEPREDGADANLLGGGTVPSGDQPDQGGTGEGVTGEGTSTGGSGGSGGGSGAGTGSGGGTGTGGGGTTTPTGGPPPPTPDPTADPTEEPTPKPTPTASEEPSPGPTPSPTVSPTTTPTGAPVSPNAGG